MSVEHKPTRRTSEVTATCLVNGCPWSTTQYVGPSYPPAAEIVAREAGIHLEQTGHEIHIGKQP